LDIKKYKTILILSLILIIATLVMVVIPTKPAVPKQRTIFYQVPELSNYVDVPLAGLSPDMLVGIIGQVRVGIIESGKGDIYLDDRTKIEEDALDSIVTAIDYVESVTERKDLDYYVSYDMHTESISGGSSGSTIALGFISLIQGKEIDHKNLITGRIDRHGNLISGTAVALKIVTAGKLNMSKIYVPMNKSIATAYIRETQNNRSFYVAKKVDMKKSMKDKYNMDVIEIKNLDEII